MVTANSPSGAAPQLMLAGIRVLDLTQGIAGPFCTKLLADYGAEVIKVERPGRGDLSRTLGPFPGDVPHPERSGIFLSLNTNKRSVTVDLGAPDGRAIVAGLVPETHVVVESFKPGVMERWGLGWDALRRLSPSLVMISISNFGQWGPYRDYALTEIVAYALGASMHGTGVPDREPMKLAGAAVLFQAGTLAAAATTGAYYAAEATGQGQHIDYSIMEGQAGAIDRNGPGLTAIAYSGSSPYFRAFSRRSTILPLGAYPCADGYAHFNGAQRAWWGPFCHVMGRPDLAEDPRFLGENYNSMERAEEVDEFFLPWSLAHTKREIMALCQEFAGTPINTMEDVFQDPHFRQRGFFTSVSHPVAGVLEHPGAPFIAHATPHQPGRAPLLGEHTAEVLMQRLGCSREDLAALSQAGVI